MPSSLVGRVPVLVLTAVLVPAAPLRAESPPRRLVERIVAVVDDHPILLSEVELVQRIHGDTRRAATDALVDEWLMYREARRLPQAEVTPDEEARATSGLLARVPGTTDPAGLRRLARRQVAIVKYVEFRFRPQVRIDETAVDARAGPGASAEAREAARARLEAEDLDRRIEEWVKELRAGAEVRYSEEETASRGGS